MFSFHHGVQKPTPNRNLEENEKENKLTRFTVLYIKKRIGQSYFIVLDNESNVFEKRKMSPNYDLRI